MTDTTERVEAPASNDAGTGTARRGTGLSALRLPQLQAVAAQLGIPGAGRMRKSDLVEAIRARQGGADAQPRQASADAAPAESARAEVAPQRTAPPEQGSGREHGEAPQAARRQSEPPQNEPQQREPQQAQPVNDQQPTGTAGDAATRPFDQPSASGEQGDRAPDARAAAGDQAPARSRRRERLQRDARGEAPDGAPAQDGPRADGVRADGDGQQGRSQDRDRQGSDDRQGQGAGDQAGSDRQDRNDRQAGSDRQGSNDRQGGSDRQGGNDRQGVGNDRQGGARSARDDEDDDGRGGRRRRGRYRDRKRRGRDNEGVAGEEQAPEVGEDDVLIPVAGILDVLDSYAFVRTSGYLSGPNDVYVPLGQVKRYGLRKGDAVVGAVRQPRDGEATGTGRNQKFNALVRLDTVNGMAPDEARRRVEFNKLTPLYPQERLRLETEPGVLTTRIIDLVAPIGKGQRGLIVSPPKAGKTMVLQAIANAITTNNPETHLMVVLVDERPEEVTDMQRTVKGEVIASTFDRPASDHTTVAELAIERAKRLVELGHDVVVLLDSITRLGRAYNLAAPASGRILSGGVDSSALYPPKRFFGAARNIENGGSLTILATALVDTGSKMDEVIFEEFKGTGNMELRLSRHLADKRIFPAVDVDASGTRREEILMSTEELKIVWKLRRVISALETQQALELLLDKLKSTRSNIEFLMQVQKTTPVPGNRGDD